VHNLISYFSFGLDLTLLTLASSIWLRLITLPRCYFTQVVAAGLCTADFFSNV